MRSYDTSRTIFGLVEALAWCGVIAGGFMFAIGMSAIFGSGRMGGQVGVILMIPGVIFLVFGFLTIVMIQTARAGVDTAELTGQVLKVARDQLEVSQQLLRQNDTMRMSYAALAGKSPEDRPLANYGTLAAASNGKDKTSAPGLVPGSEGSDRSDLGTQILPATGTKAREALPHGAIPFLGYTILPQSGNFWVGDQFFTSLDAAKRYVELLNE